MLDVCGSQAEHMSLQSQNGEKETMENETGLNETGWQLPEPREPN